MRSFDWLRRGAAFLRRRLTAGVRQAVTLFGLIYSLAIVLVGTAAFLSGNNLVFLILAVLFATMLVSGFISRLSLAALRLEFLLPEHVSARRTVSGKVVIGNEKRLMPSFSIHLARIENGKRLPVVYLPVIPSRSSVEAPIELWFARRGTQLDNQFLFSTRFPFGFAERRIEVVIKRELLVYPCLDPQPGFEEMLDALSGEIDSHFRGYGDEVYHIRPYLQHDSARFVDWKATAHTGELRVREFARQQDRAVEVLLDLDLGRPADHAWFEHAVECAAFLCWRLSLDGTALRLRTQNADYRLPEQADVYAMLKYLALVSPVSGKLVASFDESQNFQIILSAQPVRYQEHSGLAGVHVLGPADLPARPDTPAAPTANSVRATGN